MNQDSLALALRVALTWQEGATATCDARTVTFCIGDRRFTVSRWTARDVLAWLLLRPTQHDIPWWKDGKMPSAVMRAHNAHNALDTVGQENYPMLEQKPGERFTDVEIEHALQRELWCALLNALLPNVNTMRMIDRELVGATEDEEGPGWTARGIVLMESGELVNEGGEVAIPPATPMIRGRRDAHAIVVYCRDGTIERWSDLTVDASKTSRTGATWRFRSRVEQQVEQLVDDGLARHAITAIGRALQRKIELVERSLAEIEPLYREAKTALGGHLSYHPYYPLSR